eukprot:TRINITY_DN6166_c1_g1_i1.p1 TRINITY_DN6166_c1_g1~~TRINITY_DN6166_c1_g1_i1.p1  ORF type:complete len:267 (-),score=112.92 TRINITY_DN6166_c1_g1_i1:603-1403(-)
MRDLEHAQKAYQQAEQFEEMLVNPDLHYNCAMAYRYQEEYQLAIEHLEKAAELEPGWAQPKVDIELITNHVVQMSRSLSEKNSQRVCAKFREQINGVIKAVESGLDLISKYDDGKSNNKVDDVDVKMEMSGMGTSSSSIPSASSSSGSGSWTATTVKQLRKGENNGAVLMTFCLAQVQEAAPQGFLVVDVNEKMIALSVYNLVLGAIPAPCELTIMNPVYEPEMKVKDFSYELIRVFDPKQLLVNGKPYALDGEQGDVLELRKQKQ